MLIKDLNGKEIGLGRVVRKFETDFLDESLPSWITSDVVPTYNSISSGDGAAIFATGTSRNDTAQIELPDIDLSNFKAVRFDLLGLAFDSSVVTVELSFKDNLQIIDSETNEIPFLRINSDSLTDEDISFQIRKEGDKKRNLSLLIIPETKEIYLLQDDQVMYYKKDTDLTFSNPSTPFFLIQNKKENAVAATFRLLKCSLTLYQN